MYSFIIYVAKHTLSRNFFQIQAFTAIKNTAVYSTKQPPFTSVLKEASTPWKSEAIMPAYRVMDSKGKILPNAKEPNVSRYSYIYARILSRLPYHITTQLIIIYAYKNQQLNNFSQYCYDHYTACILRITDEVYDIIIFQ